MAAPITHIVLALLALQQIPDKDPVAFLQGTSLPDIRYLSSAVTREQTHNHAATWQSIKEEPSSFKAGMDFHDLVDRMRIAYFKEHGVYELIPDAKQHSNALKFVEDKWLSIKIADFDLTWQYITNLFTIINKQAYQFGISKKTVNRWYTLLKMYCAHRNATERIANVVCHLPMSRFSKLKTVMTHAHKYENNEKFKQIVLAFYNNFLTLLEN